MAYKINVEKGENRIFVFCVGVGILTIITGSIYFIRAFKVEEISVEGLFAIILFSIFLASLVSFWLLIILFGILLGIFQAFENLCGWLNL